MRQDVDEARNAWSAEHPADAGRLLYESLHNDFRPAWAAGVLASIRGRVPATPEVELVLTIARDRARWREAKGAFRAVRQRTLRTEDRLLRNVLLLAENVAKVVYNATEPVGRFDRDAGWQIAANVQAIIDLVDDPVFAAEAWQALLRPAAEASPH